MERLTRADVIRQGIMGALAFAAAGSAAAVAATPAAAGTEPTSDEDLAFIRLAAAAELLAIDFYTRTLASGHFSGRERSNLVAARTVERQHYGRLADLLEGPPLADDFAFTYPAGSFRTRPATVKLGTKLEGIFAGTYLGGVEVLTDVWLRLLAAQLAAAEGRHAGWLAGLGGGVTAGPVFPEPLDAEEATDALAPYLGE